MSPDREKKVADTLEKILSSREFAEPENKISIADRISDLIRDVIKWIWDLLPDSNMDKVGGFTPQAMTPAVFLLKLFAIVLIVVFVVLLVYYILRNLHRSKAVKEKADAELLTTLKDSEEVEKMAVEFYIKGDIRQGIRFLYIAMILSLNEKNIVKIDKSKTNKQYLREAMENQYIYYGDMQEFTYDFNRYWYGRSSVDKNKFDYWYSIYTSRLKEGSR
jgi:uncharacterized membrane protein